MSAYEKLKALGVGGPYENRAEGILKHALPQIVAVIDVAEKIATTDAPVWGTKDGLGFKLQDRLADLEEALGGDVT